MKDHVNIDFEKLVKVVRSLAATIDNASLNAGYRSAKKLGRSKDGLVKLNFVKGLVRDIISNTYSTIDTAPKDRIDWKALNQPYIRPSNKVTLIEGCLGPGKFEKIGQGGFGTAYLTKKNGEEVVVKIEKIKPMQLLDISKFVQSVNISKLVGSIGAGPKVFDAYACLYDKQHYFVIWMEYIKGPTFLQYSKTASRTDIQRVYDLLQPKIDKIHAAGIIHADLNPNNIIVILKKNKIHDVVPIDFGISRDPRSWEVQAVKRMFKSRELSERNTAIAAHLIEQNIIKFK